ncbi:LysR substrate-binding domain-containing protein [Thioclava electrotropha]|uniref:LysR family transcriptional regulator n=1 Tax=Thioclava electrotropha TaxID=1549850 RepID=A0ABX6YW49_9RHOB|nr:LysR substrate-binding domain-containing protein [Thioclava electrotropha]QPZ92097.1 LysR family transcriptional regulator [Thioclava electrotropha]
MTPEQLRVFVAVAEEQHMTRAAARLNMTQSTASAAIAALEARHEIALFDRIGRGISLTEEGRAFLPEARAVLARFAEAEAMLAETRGLERGHIRLIASQTIAGYWLPPYLAAFRQARPGIEVTLEIGNTQEAAERLRAGLHDLALVEGDVEDAKLERVQIGADRLMLVSAAPPPGKLDARALSKASWVLREPGSGTRSTAEAALADLGVAPHALSKALVLPSNEAVLSAVEAGAGITILSAHVVARSLSLGTVQDWDLHLAPRPFYALRHRDHHVSHATRDLLARIDQSQLDDLTQTE